jgi:hypothetical protein
MSNDKTNGSLPAFPTDAGHFKYQTEWKGMSLRQYAAIKLRVPDSGEEWLDDMIRKSLRDEFAGNAAQGLLANTDSHWRVTGEQAAQGMIWADLVAIEAGQVADALLKAREQ